MVYEYVYIIRCLDITNSIKQTWHQPRYMVANPSRGQLERELVFFIFPFRVSENMVSQEDRFDGPIPRQPAHSPHQG